MTTTNQSKLRIRSHLPWAPPGLELLGGSRGLPTGRLPASPPARPPRHPPATRLNFLDSWQKRRLYLASYVKDLLDWYSCRQTRPVGKYGTRMCIMHTYTHIYIYIYIYGVICVKYALTTIQYFFFFYYYFIFMFTSQYANRHVDGTIQ